MKSIDLDKTLEALVNEAKKENCDPKLRLAYLLARLIKSNDTEHMEKLLKFIENLEQK
jgi:ribosomal 50S subunit-associated protein YjgA (DUF615 family)